MGPDVRERAEITTASGAEQVLRLMFELVEVRADW